MKKVRRPRKQKPETQYNMNLVRLIDEYDTDDVCRQRLEELRWPDGMVCPRCESRKIARSYARKQFICDGCTYNFSVTSGTMMHDTHLPLRKWFLAVYLICESKKSISANQLKRTLGVQYRTAWYLNHRIRHALGQARLNMERLSEVIEVDETFVGGKVKGEGRGYKGNKAVVVGVVQRDGDLVLRVKSDRSKKTLQEFVLSHTDPNVRAIFTDEWPSYSGIGGGTIRHETVNHSQEEYVRGEVHTNTAESIWSLLKRSIIGTFHHVSVKHLDAYLDELAWRQGNRNNPGIFIHTLAQLVSAEHVEYRELTA